ncbi:MAG: DUF4351 domain-containing protein [Cyanobacteria bacterium J06598_3]
MFDRPFSQESYINPFEAAEIANFSADEQDAYEDSLKYYRDIKNVVDTSKEEGREEGREEATIKLIIRQLKKRFGPLLERTQAAISTVPIESLETLSEDLLDFTTLDDLASWLTSQSV